jgi:hypothetical protein
MFPTSTPFATANAALEKKPIYIVEISSYARAFSTTPALGTFAGLSPTIPIQSDMRANPGGATTYPNSLTFPSSTPAGNLIFAFMRIGDSGTSPHISDTAGSTWTLLYTDNASVAIWYTVSAGIPANNTIFMDSYGGTGAGTNANCQFYAVEVSSTYSGFTHSSSPASGASGLASATVGGNTLNVPLSAGTVWNLYLIALAPANSTFTGVNLGFLWNFGTPSDPSQTVLTDAPFSSLVQGVQTTAYDWIVTLEDLKETISDLDGGATLSDFVFNVQDTGQQITADLASFVFEGKPMRLLHGFQGMNLVDYATLFTGVVNTVESDNGNNEYKFTCSPKNLTKLSAKIYTTGGDGFPIDSTHTRLINAHPLDVLVSALQQAGIVLSDVDTAKIYFYRDNLFSGLQFTFTLTSAPTAKDFIENELMKPLGMYIRENNLATITVNSFYPSLSGAGGYTPPVPPVKTLTIDETTDVPLPDEAPLVNQVITKFDDDGSGNQKFLAENISNYDVSVAKYGLVGGHTIESAGLRSSFQGYLISDIVSFLIFLRYGLKNLIIDPLPCTWDNVTLEPGDIIALTEPHVPDRKAGVLGITAQTFEILDRNWRLMDGIAELKLLAIDLTKFKQYLITPNAEPSFAADTAPNQAKYMYLCNAAGKYSTGANANTLG